MRNVRLDEAQTGIKIPGRNINNLWYADNVTLMAESEEEPKSLLMKVKEWKRWLKTQHSKKKKKKLNIQTMKIIRSHHFMANRWGNNGNSDRLYIWGLQNSCRWWLQPWNSKKLAPCKKSYDQPRQHIKRQRHYFSDKGLSSQTDLAMVFPVVTHGCEVWTIKKAEHRRIDAIELPCLEGFWGSLGLQGDQTCESQRKSVLNFLWTGWRWSWNSNTLITWCKELTPWKRLWCCKRLKAGGEGDDRGWDSWMASRTWWTWVWASSGS